MITLILTLLAALSIGHALPQPLPEENLQFRLFSDLSYFKTTANYDIGGGSFTSLTGGRYYQQILSETGVQFWITPEWSAIFQLGVAGAKSNDGSFTRSNSGLTELTAGTRYTSNAGNFYFFPELLFSYPLNRVDKLTDEVLTGEGAMAVEGGSWIAYQLGGFTPYGKFSFRYQDEGRASHLMWIVGTDYTMGRFRPFFEGRGSIVAVSDKYTDSRFERDNVTVIVNGGSYKFFSVNPSEIALRAGTYFDLPWDLRATASYEQTINGKASAAGYTALVGLQWNVPGSASEISQSEERQFKAEEPKYNQKLFEQSKPNRKKRIRKKKAPMDVDKSLEDVQKTLEQNQ